MSETTDPVSDQAGIEENTLPLCVNNDARGEGEGVGDRNEAITTTQTVPQAPPEKIHPNLPDDMQDPDLSPRDAEILARMLQANDDTGASRKPWIAKRTQEQVAALQGAGGALATALGLRDARAGCYLVELASHGLVTIACRRAGWAGPYALSRYRKDFPGFEDLERRALEAAADRLEAEVKRRAEDGVDEPVYGRLPGKDAGEGVVGHVRKYSDRLAELLLKGRRREVFGDKQAQVGELPVVSFSMYIGADGSVSVGGRVGPAPQHAQPESLPNPEGV